MIVKVVFKKGKSNMSDNLLLMLVTCEGGMMKTVQYEC